MNFASNIFLIFSMFLINNIIAYTYYSEVGMYYKPHNEKISWNEAVKICESEDASLAMPRTRDEVNVLLRILKYSYILVGYHSLFTIHKFSTINGDDLQYYYNIWDPNLAKYGVGMCGYMTNSGGMHDAPCKQNFPFVCEKQTSSRKKATSDPNCQTTDTEYRFAPEIEKCYKFHMNPETFITAEKICKAEGGHLAVIRNLKEEQFLSRVFKEPKYSGFHSALPPYAFVGVHDKFEKGVYRTVFNEFFSDIEYANWDPKAPKAATANCISMNKEGMLYDLACETMRIFICEQPSIRAKNTSQTQMTRTEDFRSSRENIILNVVLNMKHDSADSNIELCNHN